MRCSPPGSSSSPQGNGPVRTGPRRVLPLGFGRQARAGPAQYATASFQDTCTTGWSHALFDRRLRTLGVAPVRAVHLAPPLRADDAPGVGEALGQETREHERPAVALGVGDVARWRRRTRRRRRWSRRSGRSRTRSPRPRARGLPRRPGRPTPIVAHQERPTRHVDERRRVSSGCRSHHRCGGMTVRGTRSATRGVSFTSTPRPSRDPRYVHLALRLALELAAEQRAAVVVQVDARRFLGERLLPSAVEGEDAEGVADHEGDRGAHPRVEPGRVAQHPDDPGEERDASRTTRRG